MARAVEDGGLAADVPAPVRHHLAAARMVQRSLARGMRIEVYRVVDALARARIDCVLLKGSAYLMADLPPARDRVFGDIDVLVPHDELARAESALLGGGWLCSDLTAYNQRYYREWMHEIPPLVHVTRGSIVDLHHTIVPPTSRYRIDGSELLGATRLIDPDRGIRVLQPVDMVLHSAVHLFTEGEFDHGLRDLLDLDDLLCHFEHREPDFWAELFARARVLKLDRPLFYALSNIERLFGERVPALQRAAFDASRPAWLQRAVMAWLLAIAMRPDHAEARAPGEGVARWLLYVRSHWLRMPLRLLVPHLVRKAWMKRFAHRSPPPPDPARP
jgi:hypothetical protein